MKTMQQALGLGFALLALSACAKTTSSGGSSETHFLALCNASCEDGFSCLCGVCTESCDSDDACEALNGEASCVTADDGCGTPKVCDVECDDDDDCAALGARHECDAGRCRAPAQDDPSAGAGGTGAIDGGMSGAGGASGGPGDGGTASGDLDECTIRAAAEHLAGDNALAECDFELPADRANCVRELVDSERPFVVSWQEQGIDSVIKEGFVGVPEATGYRIYNLSYDSVGTATDLHPMEGWITRWQSCLSFEVNDACDTIGDCFSCTDDEAHECGCSVDAPLNVVCAAVRGPTDQCDAPSCEIDGVCYPDGESTEDGCCSCEDGEYSCIEPGWCPGWTSISKRCDDDVCGAGLECRDDIKGGMKVCTRPCNYGCPGDTECVVAPNLDDEPITEGLCLLPCDRHGDCNVGGTSLESLCIVVDPDEGQGYCL